MRVLFGKRQCPSVCFCKPSSHLFPPEPLNLDKTPRVPSSAPISVFHATDKLSSEVTEVKEPNVDGKQQGGNVLKSSLKMKRDSESDPGATKEGAGKRVQWKDNLGKELVAIKEFEANEIEAHNSGYEENRNSICVIL